MLFLSFFRRNLGFLKLGVLSNLEYRFNFFTDAVLQPAMVAGVEVLLWIAIFKSTADTSIAGFSQESYLAYAIWAAFLTRISTNWMYEAYMINEIDSGSINAILVRPFSFFEYYWSQFFGYKIISTAISLLIPLLVTYFISSPIIYSRVPLALVLVFYYLFMTYLLSTCITALAFFFNRVHALTTSKNFFLWILSGELFPLDIVPEPYRHWLISLPFSSAVFLPVGYITGRVTNEVFWGGFSSVTIGIFLFGGCAYLLWQKGSSVYSGTGA
jgi:ABC-2 type transport system permease protein